jgi:hypothetical protein
MDEDLWQWFLQTAAQGQEVALPVACAWCWKETHPRDPFPSHWSSTLCSSHNVEIRQQYATRRNSPSRIVCAKSL